MITTLFFGSRFTYRFTYIIGKTAIFNIKRFRKEEERYFEHGDTEPFILCVSVTPCSKKEAVPKLIQPPFSFIGLIDYFTTYFLPLKI